MQEPDSLEIVGRLVLALLLAGAVGWDRERKHKSAGLRTHMLVSLGAAGFAIAGTSLLVGEGANELSRVVQGIIGGVGFLGAGSIIQSRHNVRGMTTAAGIWSTAAVGVACGLGEYVLAVTLAVLSLIVLSAAMVLESRLLDTADEPGDKST